MKQYEAEQSPEILEKLIQLSAQWAAEQSCYGYYPNTEADIAGKRIFLAEDEDGIEAYLLGKLETAKNMKSIMPEGTLYFEVENCTLFRKSAHRESAKRCFALRKKQSRRMCNLSCSVLRVRTARRFYIFTWMNWGCSSGVRGYSRRWENKQRLFSLVYSCKWNDI